MKNALYYGNYYDQERNCSGSIICAEKIKFTQLNKSQQKTILKVYKL
jgi:hypothetical protein